MASEKMATLGTLLLGGTLLLLGMLATAMAMATGQLMLMLAAVALLLLPAGLLLAPVIGEWCGCRIGFGLFLPRGGSGPPPEHSRLRGMIARGEYAEARRELEERLTADPGNPLLIRLLVELLLDKEGDCRDAAGLLAVYFERPDRDPADGELALRLVDAYLDLGEPELAKAALRAELARDYLGKNDRQDLARRLAGLETEARE